MAVHRKQGSGVVYTGTAAIEHVELYSLTGGVDVQLIDGSDSSGRTFLDISVLSGQSRESNRVEYVRTGVYMAMTGAGIVSIGVR